MEAENSDDSDNESIVEEESMADRFETINNALKDQLEHFAKSGVGDDVFDSIEEDVLEDNTLAYLTTSQIMEQAETDALENDMQAELNASPLVVGLDINGKGNNNEDENEDNNMVITSGF